MHAPDASIDPNLSTILARQSCFEGLESQIIDDLARHTLSAHYERDQIVLMEGEPCTGLGIVHTGRLKAVRLSVAGREQILSILRPGEIFNAASVLADVPNPVTILTLESADLWFIARESLTLLQERYPSLTRVIARNLARRVLALVDLVEDLSLRTVEMRLARQLLTNAQGNAVQREAWATQAEISARLGTVTYVLNRTLRGLEEEGLIRVERDEITILDVEGLAARAEPR